ncbi:MAG: translation initiation factor IF-3 [Limisphaerales bacterium]
MSRPFSPRNSSSAAHLRVNGKIRAREVRVIDGNDKNLGILLLNDALQLARQHGVDLVEISPTANPPVCRLVQIGKFRYEQAKKEKESRKHQHASSVKEIQLSPRIDPHDLGIKLTHAVDFLCEDMKVKVALKFRGREMAHTEIGFEVIQKFMGHISPYGHPDSDPKLTGRNIVVMITPWPRNKRAKNPRQTEPGGTADKPHEPMRHEPVSVADTRVPPAKDKNYAQAPHKPPGFVNSPFANLEAKS